jgi:hypothetical protein
MENDPRERARLPARRTLPRGRLCFRRRRRGRGWGGGRSAGGSAAEQRNAWAAAAAVGVAGTCSSLKKIMIAIFGTAKKSLQPTCHAPCMPVHCARLRRGRSAAPALLCTNAASTADVVVFVGVAAATSRTHVAGRGGRALPAPRSAACTNAAAPRRAGCWFCCRRRQQQRGSRRLGGCAQAIRAGARSLRQPSAAVGCNDGRRAAAAS